MQGSMQAGKLYVWGLTMHTFPVQVKCEFDRAGLASLSNNAIEVREIGGSQWRQRMMCCEMASQCSACASRPLPAV